MVSDSAGEIRGNGNGKMLDPRGIDAKTFALQFACIEGQPMGTLSYFSNVCGSLDRTISNAKRRLARVSFRLTALLVATAIAASAIPAHATPVWYQGAVQLVYPLNDGSFAIGVATTLPTCYGSGSGGVYLYVTPGQNAVTLDGAKSMLATVLTAFTSARTVEVAYDDSTSYCYVNRLLMQ